MNPAAPSPSSCGAAAGSAPAPLHEDPGLQPERTTLAWGRTLMSIVVTAALLLRWLPEHGWAVALPLAAALLLTVGIWLRQKLRYNRESRGIAAGRVAPAATDVLWVGGAVVVLAALGILTVLGA